MAGVLLGAGIAMADLIRQAEGACAERGAALAAAWNLHTAVCDSMMGMCRKPKLILHPASCEQVCPREKDLGVLLTGIPSGYWHSCTAAR